MLQMGFQEPVEKIFNEMPDNKQTTLWSATMPREFDGLLCAVRSRIVVPGGFM